MYLRYAASLHELTSNKLMRTSSLMGCVVVIFFLLMLPTYSVNITDACLVTSVASCPVQASSLLVFSSRAKWEARVLCDKRQPFTCEGESEIKEAALARALPLVVTRLDLVTTEDLGAADSAVLEPYQPSGGRELALMVNVTSAVQDPGIYAVKNSAGGLLACGIVVADSANDERDGWFLVEYNSPTARSVEVATSRHEALVLARRRRQSEQVFDQRGNGTVVLWKVHDQIYNKCDRTIGEEAFFQGLSTWQHNSIEPCTSLSGDPRGVQQDLSPVLKEIDSDAVQASLYSTKPMCTKLANGTNNFDRGAAGGTFRRSQNGEDWHWEPANCTYKVVDRRSVVESFKKAHIKKIFVFGDSIGLYFKAALEKLLGKNSQVTFEGTNGPGGKYSGWGLSYLIDGCDDVASLKRMHRSLAQNPDLVESLRLHPTHWPQFITSIQKADVAIINSGAHDISFYGNQRVSSKMSRHEGDKPAVEGIYLGLVRRVFLELARAHLNHKVVWRLTSHVHYFQPPDHPGEVNRFAHCAFNPVSLPSVIRTNAGVVHLGKLSGVRTWDITGLSLGAIPRIHSAPGFIGIIHPSETGVLEWIKVFAHEFLDL